MKDLTLSIAQMSPVFLDIRENTCRMTGFMEQAAIDGSDLLLFPEMALTGYGIGDTIRNPDVRRMLEGEARRSLAEIRKASRRLNLDVLVSYPLFSGGKTYIAAEYISNGKKAALHRKINLCNYAHYTEHLHFTEGFSPTVVTAERGTFGILVCEDSWHAMNGIVETLLGAEILVVPSAPSVLERPLGKESMSRWEAITKSTAFLQTCYVVVGALAGTEGNCHFLGGSHVVSPEGEFLCRLPLFEEALAQVRLEAALLEKAREMRPLLRNERIGIYRKIFAEMGKKSGRTGK